MSEISLTPEEPEVPQEKEKMANENYGKFNLDVYSPGDIADRLGISRNEVLKQISNKRLRAKFFGGPIGYRVMHADLISWMNSD